MEQLCLTLFRGLAYYFDKVSQRNNNVKNQKNGVK